MHKGKGNVRKEVRVRIRIRIKFGNEGERNVKVRILGGFRVKVRLTVRVDRGYS